MTGIFCDVRPEGFEPPAYCSVAAGRSQACADGDHDDCLGGGCSCFCHFDDTDERHGFFCACDDCTEQYHPGIHRDDMALAA
jgi:hypothetical protein